MSLFPSSKIHASGAWKKKTRLGFGLGHGGSVRPSPNHGLSTDRPTFSHERHVDLEKTLLNDGAAAPMDSEEQPKDLHQDLDDDNEDAMFNWDSEQSLLYDLMDEGHTSPTDPFPTLLTTLTTSFLQKRTQFKHEIAETCVPVMNHILAQHASAAQECDVPYAKGLKMFNNASKELEGASLREYEEVGGGFEEIRGNIASLIDRLKVEYDARDKLWADVQAQITEITDTTLTSIQAAPAQVERTIAKLDRYYQNQVESGGKEGGGGLDERRLKELISKLG